MIIDTDYDGIVIGAGHNGLILANYLAAAGQKILVIEATDIVGGGLRTIEGPVAGFYFNPHAVAIQGHSIYKIWEDLDLTKYGATAIKPRVQYAMALEDGRAVALHSELEETVASIARISERDAKAFRTLSHQVETLVRDVFSAERLSAPLPPDEAEDLLSRSESGRLYLEFARESVLDLIESHFENPHVQAMLGFLSSFRGHLPVLDKKGNGHVLPALVHAGFKGGIVEGGSDRLAKALVASLWAKGGVVAKGMPVERIVIEGGRATGVVARGRTFRARNFVASSLIPKQTLLELVGTERLEPGLVERINAIKPKSEALFGVHIAHHALPKFQAEEFDPSVAEAFSVVCAYETLDDVKSDMRDIRDGIPPARPKISHHTITNLDPSQAPPGCHVSLLWIFAPNVLAEGGLEGWREYGPVYGEKVLDVLEEYAPGVRDTITGYYVHSPIETAELIPSMVLGDRHHGEYLPNQMGWYRPLPELSQYRTPIERLYMCGASTHPGGSITGAPGHNAAGEIADDLSLPKWWNPPDIRAVLRNLK